MRQEVKIDDRIYGLMQAIAFRCVGGVQVDAYERAMNMIHPYFHLEVTVLCDEMLTNSTLNCPQ